MIPSIGGATGQNGALCLASGGQAAIFRQMHARGLVGSRRAAASGGGLFDVGSAGRRRGAACLGQARRSPQHESCFSTSADRHEKGRQSSLLAHVGNTSLHK